MQLSTLRRTNQIKENELKGNLFANFFNFILKSILSLNNTKINVLYGINNENLYQSCNPMKIEIIK